MFLIFFTLWVIFNERLTLEIAIFGIVISVLMYLFICRFMGFSVKRDIMLIRSAPLCIVYAGMMIAEIFKANINVLKLVLSPKYEAEPVLVHFTTKLKTKSAQVVLANSITITPGTITVSLEDGEFVVHCLDRDFASGLDDNHLTDMLLRIEKNLKISEHGKERKLK